ncbi:MAG: bifunctional nuclease family protein [bacterium]|nr:bifunctional nuclease family protein [bacterium]
MTQQIEVKLIGLVLEPVSKAPVIILKPVEENKIIPIWIGEFEANAITMELENIAAPRPMTHDLINDIILHLSSRVEKIVITDFVENTYYAELYIRKNDELFVIDCRPSDAVAVALKNRVKIYISDVVYNTAMLSDFFSNFVHNEERFEKWFNSLSSEDFGNVEQ